MSLSRIADFLGRRHVSEKLRLAHLRDLYEMDRDHWRAYAFKRADDCNRLQAKLDEARAQLGFANEEIAKLSRKLGDLYPRLYAAEEARDTALQKVEWLEDELRRRGWGASDFDDLYQHEEPWTKQDVAEEVGHQKYRERVDEEEVRKAEKS